MKKQSVLISAFLMVALSLVFIGCDTGANSTSGDSVDLSKISIGDIPSLEKLGLSAIEIPEDLADFKAPAGWILVNFFDQIPGTWVSVEEDFGKMLKKLTKVMKL